MLARHLTSDYVQSLCILVTQATERAIAGGAVLPDAHDEASQELLTDLRLMRTGFPMVAAIARAWKASDEDVKTLLRPLSLSNTETKQDLGERRVVLQKLSAQAESHRVGKAMGLESDPPWPTWHLSDTIDATVFDVLIACRDVVRDWKHEEFYESYAENFEFLNRVAGRLEVLLRVGTPQIEGVHFIVRSLLKVSKAPTLQWILDVLNKFDHGIRVGFFMSPIFNTAYFDLKFGEYWPLVRLWMKEGMAADLERVATASHEVLEQEVERVEAIMQLRRERIARRDVAVAWREQAWAEETGASSQSPGGIDVYRSAPSPTKQQLITHLEEMIEIMKSAVAVENVYPPADENGKVKCQVILHGAANATEGEHLWDEQLKAMVQLLTSAERLFLVMGRTRSPVRFDGGRDDPNREVGTFDIIDPETQTFRKYVVVMYLRDADIPQVLTLENRTDVCESLTFWKEFAEQLPEPANTIPAKGIPILGTIGTQSDTATKKKQSQPKCKLRADRQKGKVFLNGQPMTLAGQTLEVAMLIVEAKGAIVSFGDLARAMGDMIDKNCVLTEAPNTLRVLISRINKQIHKVTQIQHAIERKTNQGYRLTTFRKRLH